MLTLTFTGDDEALLTLEQTSRQHSGVKVESAVLTLNVHVDGMVTKYQLPAVERGIATSAYMILGNLIRQGRITVGDGERALDVLDRLATGQAGRRTFTVRRDSEAV